MSEISKKLEDLNSRYEKILQEHADVEIEDELAKKALEDANANVEALEEELKTLESEIDECHHARRCHEADKQEKLAELVKTFPEAGDVAKIKRLVREKEELKQGTVDKLQAAVNARYPVRERAHEMDWRCFYVESEQKKIEKEMKDLVDKS